MIRLCLLGSFIAASLLLAGCGASNAQKQNTTPTPGSNSELLPTGNAVPRAVSKANDGTEGPSNVAPTPGVGDRVDIRSRRKERYDVDPSATPPPMTFAKAAENSEYGTSMDRDGTVIERRIFTGHPQLRTAEVKWLDPKTRSLKLTFKNGKIIELKAVEIANLRTIPTIELLKMAGVSTGAK